MASYSAKISNRYPSVNCETIKSDYGTQLENYAAADYDYITEFPDKQSTGTLQCFCQQ